MSYRRAFIRQEKRRKEKLEKRKDSAGKFLREKNNGYDEGKILASAVGVECLYNVFGWRKSRIEKAFRHINEQAKGDTEVLKYVCTIYQEKLIEGLKEKKLLDKKVYVNSPFERAKVCERNEIYVTCAGLIMNVLKSHYNFGSNSNHNGRLDKVQQYFEMRFNDMNQNPKYYGAQVYAERVKQETGVCIM